MRCNLLNVTMGLLVVAVFGLAGCGGGGDSGGIPLPLPAADKSVAVISVPFGTYEGYTVNNGKIGSYFSVSILTNGDSYGVITNPSGQASAGLSGTTDSAGKISYSYQFYNDLLKGNIQGTSLYDSADKAALNMTFVDNYNGGNTTYTGTFNRKFVTNPATSLYGTYALEGTRVVYTDGTVLDTTNGSMTAKAYFKIGTSTMRQGGMFNNTIPFNAFGSYSISGSTINVSGGSLQFSTNGVHLQTILVSPTFTETDSWIKVSDNLVGGTIAYKEVPDNGNSWNNAGDLLKK